MLLNFLYGTAIKGMLHKFYLSLNVFSIIKENIFKYQSTVTPHSQNDYTQALIIVSVRLNNRQYFRCAQVDTEHMTVEQEVKCESVEI